MPLCPRISWPADERDLDAMDAAMSTAVLLVCETRTSRQKANQPSPALEVDFYDPRTLVIVRETGHGLAEVWIHRVGAPSSCQMQQPAILAL